MRRRPQRVQPRTEDLKSSSLTPPKREVLEQTLDPTSSFAHHKRGIALYYLKRYEEALAACDLALRLNPQDAIAHYNKGLALYSLNRHEDALAAYDLALRLDPQYAETHYD